MASDTQICNIALARLGDEAGVSSINPPDQSAQANYCAKFYPISLAAILDDHDWGFATKTIILPLLNNPYELWSYCYGLPSDFINVVALFDYSAVGDVNGLPDHGNQQDFSVELSDNGTQVIYTNQVNAIMKYVAYVTNAEQFPPAFVNAFAWRLAADLAGVIIKGDVGVSAAAKCIQAYEIALAKAIESDASNRKAFVKPMPSGIAARA